MLTLVVVAVAVVLVHAGGAGRGAAGDIEAGVEAEALGLEEVLLAVGHPVVVVDLADVGEGPDGGADVAALGGDVIVVEVEVVGANDGEESGAGGSDGELVEVHDGGCVVVVVIVGWCLGRRRLMLMDGSDELN